MKLSFVVPVYNAEKYLDNCIGSLYRQNLQESDFEVICVNDGSKDGSLEVLKRWQALHSNLVIINQKNGGLSKARNVGICAASGEYIRFIDSDDYIADGVTNDAINIAINNKLDILYTSTLETNREDEYKPRFSECNAKSITISSGKDYFANNNTPNGAWEYFISRDFILRNNLNFEEGRICEDGMFMVTSLTLAQRVSKCNVDYYRYIQRPNSITTRKDLKHMQKTADDFAYAIEYINNVIISEKQAYGNTEYVKKLVQRRNSYFFYFQIRAIKACFSRNQIKSYLKNFRVDGCYPNSGLTKDYYFTHKLLSKLFQFEWLYLLLCNGYKVIQKFENR